MAARFWVGSGTWDATNTANWSATTGGATGASVPTSADTVTFDGSSGNCSIDVSVSCSTLTIAAAYAGIFIGPSPSQATITISGSGAALTIASGSTAAIVDVFFSLTQTATATAINVSIAGMLQVTNTQLGIGFGVSSAATFTLTTNAAFYKDASNFINLALYSGTLSSGTIASSLNNLTVFGGTYNPAATTVTVNGSLLVTPTTSASVTLNTSTITALNGTIQLGNSNGSQTTTVTAGATQTLSASILNIYVTSSTTLRTLTCSQLDIVLNSGVALTAGVVTCNATMFAGAQAGYATLPTLAVTSITGSSSVNVTVTISEVGFTCGAISLTTSAGSTLSYVEQSKGTVNVTGAITLVDTNLTVTSPLISIASQAAFSGGLTVGYAALNASVRGTVNFVNNRAVSVTTIATRYIIGTQTANVTTGAITLGGTLSATVYNDAYINITNTGATVTIASIAQGTGVTATDVLVSGTGNLSITGAVGCSWFSPQNSGTTTIGGTITVANPTNAQNGLVEFYNCSSISLASVTVTGLFVNAAMIFGNTAGSKPQVGAVTISGTLTAGVAGTRGFAVFDSTGNVNLSSTTATHLLSAFYVDNCVDLTFGAGSTLSLNKPVTSFDRAIYVNSASGALVTFRTVTCDSTNGGGCDIVVQAPSAAVTFGTLTAGAAGAKAGFVITAASLTCAATDVGFYSANLSGALTQSGALTISTPTPLEPGIVSITVGGTSTLSSLVASAVTNTGVVYTTTLAGAGSLTISGVVTGPAVTAESQLIINKAGATIFSGAISNFTDFLHTAGNVTFTGALAVGVTRTFKLTSGFTVTPNTSTITISGAYDATATLDHGGYTLPTVSFSATGISQFIKNTTSATALTCTTLTSIGGASPTAMLQLGTNVTVSGTFTFTPNSLVNRHLLCSNAYGTARTITAATRTFATGGDYRDITISGAVLNLSAGSAGDAGGNTNITFTTPVTRWVATTGGSWDSTAIWSATSGGATGVTAPLAQDTVNIANLTAPLYTNQRKFLGSNIVFTGGTGTGTGVYFYGTCAALGSIDMENYTGRLQGYSGGGTFCIQANSNAVFKPFSNGSSWFAVVLVLMSRSGASMTLGGANDLNFGSTGNSATAIACSSFNTNTGTRIVNFNLSSLTIGSYQDAYSNTPYAACTSTLNSSTITCVNDLTYAGTVNGNTHTANAALMLFYGAITATSATFSAVSASFNNGSAISLGASTVTVNNAVAINTGCTYVEDTTEIRLKPVSQTSFGISISETATVYRVVVDDVNSTAPTTTRLLLTTSFSSNTNQAIRFFDTSAMRRNLEIGGGSRLNVYGGLNAIFSNKGCTYLNTKGINVFGTNPLYVPYVYVQNCTVTTGSVVAYGPANLGGNTGSITYPSKLRYYAFVDTGATSFVVPPDYNGMGLFVAIGGGATPSSVLSNGQAKGGGGGGGNAYKFVLPINNTFAPLAIGQTVYINAGNYATAPVANTVGANGNQSWVNISSNAVPTLSSEGVIGLGGATTTTQSGGAGGLTTFADIGIAGGAGGTSASGIYGGGGGGSSLFAGGAASVTNTGGSGGGGTTSIGVVSNSAAGNGSAGGDGSVSGGAGGTGGTIGGTPPTAGAAGSASTGAAGGGGGTNLFLGTAILATQVARNAGSTTITITQASHGLTNGQQIGIYLLNALKSGTYSRSLTTVTVTITNHGLLLGDSFYFDGTSGTQVDGTFTVTQVISANQFRFTSATSGSTSGNCQLGQSGLTNNTAYTITYVDASTFTIVGSVSTILSSGQFSISYRTVGTSDVRGANGGAGATNSAQYFIRYYNGSYSPGYFGVGAGGGGAGGAQANFGESGSGGAGGIGAGGGGRGRSGLYSTQIASPTAISGRGGPGMVMFIYALRANNQSAIQGM